MTITKLWESYKGLPIWKKILLALPFLVVVVLFGAIYIFVKNPTTNETVVDFSKSKTDAEVKELGQTTSQINEEVVKIDLKKQELKNELDDTHEKYSEFSSRIDSATDGDELVRIAADLRAAAAKRKQQVSTGSGHPD
jgi:peptidoglycan hydrolase CwlO-like protein